MLACHCEPLISACSFCGPGQPDRFGDELGGTPRPFHGEFSEHGAGEFTGGPAGPLAFQGARGFCAFVEPAGARRVIEQAQLRARWR